MAEPGLGRAAAADARTTPDERQVRLWRWRPRPLGSDGSPDEGASTGTSAGPHGVVIATPAGVRRHRDPHGNGATTDYEYASWTSPQVAADFAATEIVTWWQATTPPGTWIEVAFRPARANGTNGPWYVMSRWAGHDTELHPTSVGGQADHASAVNADEYIAATGDADAVTAGCVRLTLHRRAGSTATPTVHAAGMTTSRHARRMLEVSRPGPSVGRRLAVPAYSQRLHADCHTHWNGGGHSWCSPTSTAMVLAYHDSLPAAEDWAWVGSGCVAPVVPHAVRGCYDYGYAGAGNWAFNTAYVVSRGLDAFVTRLRSVSEAEWFIAAGVPVVASVKVKAAQLTGAGYDSAGHLLVLTGTTDTGDVLVNDPAAATDAEVPRVYDRGQFEAAWLGGSGGVAYIIHPPDTPLPAAPAQPNW